MKTKLQSGVVKTFVMYLIYGSTLEEAKNNYNYGCQKTILINVNQDNCLKGWTGLPNSELTLELLRSKGLDQEITRTEPIELMQGCRVLGCLDPLTGKYQTLTTNISPNNVTVPHESWLTTWPQNLSKYNSDCLNLRAKMPGKKE